jgi:hypothetical protein
MGSLVVPETLAISRGLLRLHEFDALSICQKGHPGDDNHIASLDTFLNVYQGVRADAGTEADGFAFDA